MEKTIRLYTLSYSEAKTYWMALLFAVGNIALPQLCHLVPQGGVTWLPIYFFTLVGAYKYGWKVGLLTALASPIANSLLFGMPAQAMLPAILTKSTLLAFAAGWMAQRTQQVTLLSLLGVVLAYQTAGALGEWALTNSLHTALQDFRIGLPGMAMQVIGGYAVLRQIKN
ncbi:MAG: ECF transporter S component [Bacteroidaceae bacterium]|nr:ECF transporter S component [Bacteroidaceae bacterium]